MTGNLVTAALTSTLFFSSVLSTPPASSQAASFTQAIPENNFVLHTVTDGESLAIIAKNYYGSEDYWTTIWDDNPWIEDATKIEKGWLIKIRTAKPDKVEDLTTDLQKKWDTLQETQQDDTETVVSAINSLPSSQPTSYDAIYKAAGAKFGIPWQILYGIHMTETGGRNGAISSGYGSGAQGPMQFMPATFQAYAIDGDGDGRADIDNAVDAIYTAANYLAKHGSIMAGLQAYGGNISGTVISKSERL